MVSPVVLMGPSAGVSVLGLIFCMVSAISYCDDYSCVKNVHVLKWTGEPKDGSDKMEHYWGLSHIGETKKENGEEKEVACPFEKDPLCEYEKEDSDANDDFACETKEKADSCKDDCEDKCKDESEGAKRDKCEENCEGELENHRAFKFGFAAAILGLLFFLVVIILSGLRMGPMNTMPIKIVGIVFSFLAFVFLLSGFAVLLAHPKAYFQRRFVDEYQDCTDQDASELNNQTASTATIDCEVTMGPALILMIVAWIFTLVPLICHAVCPDGIEKKDSSQINQSNQSEKKDGPISNV